MDFLIAPDGKSPSDPNTTIRIKTSLLEELKIVRSELEKSIGGNISYGQVIKSLLNAFIANKELKIEILNSQKYLKDLLEKSLSQTRAFPSYPPPAPISGKMVPPASSPKGTSTESTSTISTTKKSQAFKESQLLPGQRKEDISARENLISELHGVFEAGTLGAEGGVSFEKFIPGTFESDYNTFRKSLPELIKKFSARKFDISVFEKLSQILTDLDSNQWGVKTAFEYNRQKKLWNQIWVYFKYAIRLSESDSKSHYWVIPSIRDESINFAKIFEEKGELFAKEKAYVINIHETTATIRGFETEDEAQAFVKTETSKVLEKTPFILESSKGEGKEAKKEAKKVIPLPYIYWRVMSTEMLYQRIADAIAKFAKFAEESLYKSRVEAAELKKKKAEEMKRVQSEIAAETETTPQTIPIPPPAPISTPISSPADEIPLSTPSPRAILQYLTILNRIADQLDSGVDPCF